MMSPKFKHINAISLGEYQIKKYILVFERERERENSSPTIMIKCYDL